MSEQVRQIAMRITDLREISDYTVEQMAALCEVSPEEYARNTALTRAAVWTFPSASCSSSTSTSAWI